MDSSRGSRFQSYLDRFLSKFDLFWFKDQFRDQKSWLNDQKSQLKDQKSHLNDWKVNLYPKSPFISKNYIYIQKVNQIWYISIYFDYFSIWIEFCDLFMVQIWIEFKVLFQLIFSSLVLPHTLHKLQLNQDQPPFMFWSQLPMHCHFLLDSQSMNLPMSQSTTMM